MATTSDKGVSGDVVPTRVPGHALLAGPTDEQRRLLEIVWAAFREHGVWPLYQYVEGCMDAQNLDALAVLASFPTIRHPVRLAPSYGAVWFERAGGVYPRPDSLVVLTIAGVRHVPNGGDAIEVLLKVLAYLEERQRRIAFSPVELMRVDVAAGEIAAVDPRLSDMRPLDMLRQLLDREPPTSGVSSAGNDWTVRLRRELRLFRGVRDVEEYLNRLAAHLTPPEEPRAPLYPSPLTLPSALGYLDAVWQLRFGKRLVLLPGAEQTARLALTARTVEEFQAALSAFGEILHELAVPGVKAVKSKHPLARLSPFLKKDLADANADRLDHATRVLDDIRKIRNGVQHAGATPEANEALRRLGIGYPVTDWPTAWNQVRAHATESFNVIREEIQADRGE